MTRHHDRRRWARRGVATLGAAALTAGTLGLAVPAQADAHGEVSVLARNLYLGADVGIAIATLPDVRAAAQGMWDSAVATDFDARAPGLAAEVARLSPDVIALQEATSWFCAENQGDPLVDVWNFTDQYLQALRDAGTPYVIASQGGEEALNPGFSIGPIFAPGRLGSTITDTTGKLEAALGTGVTTATCGFQLGDAILVKEELADAVTEVGQKDYDRKLGIEGFADIVRGFVYADLTINGASARYVATHLESLWSVNDDPEPTPGSDQIRQMIADPAVANAGKPIVALGDFNADPRDPRPPGSSGTPANPGGQVEAYGACPEQVPNPTAETANIECNAFWIMINDGFASIGPDEFDPLSYTWGSDGLLAGPDVNRAQIALDAGNPWGFTDRLDYVFTKGTQDQPITTISAEAVGNVWPDSPDNWTCNDPDQVTTTQTSAGIVGATVPPGEGVCFPTDHVGLFGVLQLTPDSDGTQPPTDPPTDPSEPGTPPTLPDTGASDTAWLTLAALGLVTIGGSILWGQRKLGSES